MRVRTAGLVALSVIILGGLAALGWHTFGGNRIEADTVRPSAAIVDMQNSFVGVAHSVKPAVVSIQSRKRLPGPSMPQFERSPFGDDNGPGALYGPNGPVPGAGSRIAIGTGSGFIVRPDGWILTNDHVVQGADKVTVRLDDGREFVGDVKEDFRSDLAVVKIPATGLPTLNMADSGQVQVGQWAIAFGTPFGLRETMTVGVVSALGRESLIGEQSSDARFYPDLIQTDASVNPGNSGGPLLDISGNVMGVNVAIESPTGTSAGIGFAIPANTAKYVADQLISKGSVARGYLGFVPEDLSPTEQTQYGAQQGALISSVQEGSPAAKAGLQVEDVVTSFNGQPVRNERDLRDMVARTAPGTSVAIAITRNGQTQTINATVEGAPNTSQPVPAPTAPQPQGRLGLGVSDMTADVSSKLNLPAGTTGVVVSSVTPGSPAAEAGFEPGDVIVRINGHDVTSASQAADTIKGLQAGSEAAFVVRRRDMRMLLRSAVP